MSISSETRKAGPYAGNGVTTNLPFSFKVFSTADVRVVQTDPVGAETDLTLTTHYTVSLNADQDANPGGTVVMVTAPATGYYTTLTSKVQNLQAVTITNLGGFYPKILNDALDRLTIMVQQVAEQVSRAVKVGISSSSTPDQLIDAINTAASTASAAATSASGSAASASASASAISTYPASVQSQAFTRFIAGGTADAITGTLSPVIASYTAGLRVTATPSGANTVTGPTLNLNSLGTKTIKKRDSGGSKVALVAGDYNASGPFDFEYDGTDFIWLNPLAAAVTVKQIQPISASVGSNALTISASALSLDFRSTTLGSGAVTTVSGTPANLVISSGSTLGTVSGQQSRIAVLALNNAGTIELAAVNLAGGNDLTETGLISTTAEGGAGAADSANVVYLTTARTNVAYRVIGYIESTQATAGTWATAPSTIQGAGGNALTAMSSLGYGQTWQTVTRTSGTTYYNTTGRPISVFLNLVSTAANQNLSLVVAGVTLHSNTNTISTPGANYVYSVSFIVGPGESWVATTSLTINAFEKR